MGQKLGQHFLINKKAIKGIITTLELEKEDNLIEIGGGRGALTQELARLQKPLKLKIKIIEKDKKLAEYLANQFPNLEIIESDALKILPELIGLNTEPYKLVGNIPYYITGKLLRIIEELRFRPKLTVLTIQKEVAERICSRAGAMNLLAASVQIWAEPKIIMKLKPRDFRPVPKVESAVIELVGNEKLKAKNELENYYKLIKILFKQPRKTILNNLELLGEKEKIREKLKLLGINPEDRPQNLNIREIIKLSEDLL